MARCISFGLASLLLALPALAADPAPAPVQKTIEYRIHEVPTDATSPIVLRIRATLQQEQLRGKGESKKEKGADGGTLVGWRIMSMVIQQSDPPPSGGIISKKRRVERVWTIKKPTITSRDGLWWISHADPTKPALSEFGSLPEIKGTAKPKRGYPSTVMHNEDLVFEVKGSKYTPPAPPEEPPYNPTFAMTYKFELQRAPGNLTIKEGTDDPVEPREPVNPGDPMDPPDELRLRSR